MKKEWKGIKVLTLGVINTEAQPHYCHKDGKIHENNDIDPDTPGNQPCNHPNLGECGDPNHQPGPGTSRCCCYGS